MAEKPVAEPKQWYLDPESEYRFELDPGTSLAIKVRDVHFLARSNPENMRLETMTSSSATRGLCRDIWIRIGRREDLSLWVRV